MRSFHYLFWAYTLIWIVLAGYLLSLSLRLRSIASQLRRLKSRMPGETP
ncbi:MAG TPA: CcmD family protein [Candidatus Polarisedimenticolia bacterium]|nr:CcmD family protein [Candidatus Polarisedimenticolia bacterium]